MLFRRGAMAKAGACISRAVCGRRMLAPFHEPSPRCASMNRPMSSPLADKAPAGASPTYSNGCGGPDAVR